MSTLVTRAGKGTPLTHNEVDANFTNLNTDKVEKTSAAITGGSINGTTVGATTASTGSFTSLTDSGNLTFTGTGNRITGDFSSTPFANRVAFQTSAANTFSFISVLPSGTGNISGVSAFDNSDPNNAAQLQLRVQNGADARVQSSITGTGTYLPLTMYTGGSERLRIDTSGNVGIGTTTTSGKLNVSSSVGSAFGTNANTVTLYSTATAGVGVGSMLSFSGNTNNSTAVYGFGGIAGLKESATAGSYAGALAFYTQNSGGSSTYVEQMRIDSSGNVGIGSSSPSSRLDVSGAITSTSTGKLVMQAFGNDAYFDNTGTGNTIFRNGAGLTERMRIDSSGNLLVGTTTVTASARETIAFTSSSGGTGISYIDSQANNTATFAGFYSNTTKIGSITNNGNAAVLYNTTSDARLKTNIVDAPLGNIDDVKVRSFDWKSDKSHVEYGFIAQELVEVAPYAVHQPQDPEEMMAVDYSKLVPMMIKEIQDLKQRIKTLENK